MEVGGMVRQGLSGEWNLNKELDDQKPAARRLGSGGWGTWSLPRGQQRIQESRQEQAGGDQSSPQGPAAQGLGGLFKMFGFHQQLPEVLRHQRHDLTFSIRSRMWGMGTSGRLLHSHSCAWTGKEWSKWDGIRFRTNLVWGCTCWWIGHNKEKERNQSWCLAFGLRK